MDYMTAEDYAIRNRVVRALTRFGNDLPPSRGIIGYGVAERRAWRAVNKNENADYDDWQYMRSLTRLGYGIY